MHLSDLGFETHPSPAMHLILPSLAFLDSFPSINEQ